jgi:hypothetical protein
MALTKATHRMIEGAVVNVKDFGAVGDNVTDDTAAIQAALDYATASGTTGEGWVVYIPEGDYIVSSTLQMANATTLKGDGRHSTTIRPTSDFVGSVLTDKGNAGKIFLFDFGIRANGATGVTDLIKLGYGAVSPYGQAYSKNLYLAGDTPASGTYLSGCTAFNVVANVANFEEIETSGCENGFYEGPNSTVAVFTKCYTISCGGYEFYTGSRTTIRDCEIEGPTVDSKGIYVSRNCTIDGLTYSQANSGVTNDFVVEIDSSAVLFSLVGLKAFNGGGASTLNHVIKDNRSNYPTYWGDNGGAERSVSFVGTDIHIGSTMYLQDHKRQSFRLRLWNDAGTIKHRIRDFRNSTTSSYADRINNNTMNWTTTPTGTDTTTDFAGGGKISSAYTSVFYFDAGDQSSDTLSCYPTMIFNDTGTTLSASVIGFNYNINGNTQSHLGLWFYDATGANYALTSIPSGKSIELLIEGFIN